MHGSNQSGGSADFHFLLLWSIRICSPQLAASYSVWAVSRGHAGLTNTRTHEGVKESNIFNTDAHTHADSNYACKHNHGFPILAEKHLNMRKKYMHFTVFTDTQ